MSIPEEYKVDYLFLLVGGNPLPNYVGAQLLARPDATIVLVHSSGVIEQRDALVKELQAKGFARPEALEVEESNPRNILNKVTARVEKCSGKIGLHYTGGTKAMATHSYRAVEQVFRTRTNPVYYSYLDARTLSLVIEGTDISGSPSFPVGLDVQVSIDELLKLHGRRIDTATREPLWIETATALATIHSDSSLAALWKQWIAKTFFKEPSFPEYQEQSPSEQDKSWKQWVLETFVYQEFNSRKWKSKTYLEQTPFLLPEELSHIAPILLQEAGLSEPVTMRQIMQQSGIKKPEDFGKWLEGQWLESYILHQIHQVQGDCAVHDTAASIQSTLTRDFEFDMCAIRGYRLFAISCTTDSSKGTCKSKLLEAIVRAEQLGGSEARTALVCCYEDPTGLQEEIRGLFQGEHRVRVFGRHHLLTLKQELMDWFNET